MSVRMILAADQGNAIGWTDGSLPWKIKTDMKRFKALTTGHDVVMGRTTYLSLGLPNGLPNRRNIVLTKQPYSAVRGQFGDVEIISSFDWIDSHQNRDLGEAPDLWVIGGAKVYGEAIERQIIDEIHFTQVFENTGADVVLPFDLFSWKLFVLHQRKIGVTWEVQIDTPEQPLDEPRISFITFRKS